MAQMRGLASQHDHLREGVPGTGAAEHKEWYHFCVLGPGVDVIVNFSLATDLRPVARRGSQLGRIVLLLRERGHGWDGDVDTFPARDVQARAGTVGLHIGGSMLGYGAAGYQLSVALAERPLTARLSLYPRTLPLLARTNAVIGEGRISWLMVPRLTATGTVVVGRRTYRLVDAPAYHDHNWGQWQWGQDFTWQWGFALPSDDGQWAVVFQQMGDRTRNRVTEQIMALWRGADLYRLFHQHEIEMQQAGLMPVRPVLKLPRVLGLVAPERTTDLPQRLVVNAVSGTDRLRMTFEAYDLAQILVPHETDLGTTVINEVRGRASVEGDVKGHRVLSAGEGIYECLA